VGGLDHIIAGHLHNIGAPIELLRLIFEKIGTGKGIAISFDKTAARVVGNRGIPPPELPGGMLGVAPSRPQPRSADRVGEGKAELAEGHAGTPAMSRRGNLCCSKAAIRPSIAFAPSPTITPSCALASPREQASSTSEPSLIAAIGFPWR